MEKCVSTAGAGLTSTRVRDLLCGDAHSCFCYSCELYCCELQSA